MRGAASALAVLALLVATPAAQAAYDPVGGGTTRLVLDKRFTAFLQREGIRVSAVAGATKRGRAIVFPVSGGHVDPTLGRGEIEQGGTMVLRNARKRVPIRKLVVKTTHAPLVAKVGGSQLKVAISSAIRARRRGFATVFRAERLRLTDKVATRLNKKLRPRQPFAGGQVIGTLTSAATPLVTAVVPTGKASLVFDSAFVAKLDRNFISVNPIFPAEHLGPSFTLPIVAKGTLATDASLGTLRTGGEIEFLRLGAGQIFWRELWFDRGLQAALAEAEVQPAPPFPGKLGQVAVLHIGTGVAAADFRTRTISLAGAPLTLPATTADIFNQAFVEGREEFRAGELLGSLSFAAQGQ